MAWAGSRDKPEAHAEFIHYWVPPGMQSEKGWDVEITLITLSF